jgi:penicillin-binding protein A
VNTNIRRLGIFFLVVFAVMVVDVTYWQVIDASSMQARPDNQRLTIAANLVRRGFIYDRNGTLLAGRTIDAQGVVHRTYTDPAMSEVLGYDSQRYGKTELEQSYDGYLSGSIIGTNWNTVIKRWEHRPVVGNNLTLTINDQLQRDVEAIMPDTPSAAIVADPRNGEILAMVSKPTFDSAQIDTPGYWTSVLQNQGHPLINRDVNGFYPPGSTFKIVTLSAALDSGIMSLSTPFVGEQATGPLTVDGHVFPAAINNLYDCGGVAVSPPITLEEALVCSDNIVFAQVGLKLGWNRFLEYTHRFGLGSAPPFDIPVSASQVTAAHDQLNNVLLASSAFGQGSLYVTPLQMLMADEAIADGGSIPKPILVKTVTAPDGTVIRKASYGTLSTPISTASADQVRTAMEQVVQQGSGELAQIPGVTIAGKTGTAETQDGLLPHAWFVCFAPADHPRVAVVVLVEHGGEGATVAAPLAKQILADALPLTSP